MDKEWGLTGFASTRKLLTERMTARAFRGFGIYIAQVSWKKSVMRSYKAKVGCSKCCSWYLLFRLSVKMRMLGFMELDRAYI